MPKVRRKNSVKQAIERAIKLRDKKKFEKLLRQKNITEDDIVSLKYAFWPDSGDLTMWDLFHRLDPKSFKNKSYNSLTAYEKLYFQLFDKYFAAEIAHRLNLGGAVKLSYDKKSMGEARLDGQMSGFGIMQLKDHLLQFSAESTDKLSPGFQQALDRMLNITPQATVTPMNKKLDTDANGFIFAHVNHAWCALLTKDKLYMINMGLGADKRSPGIHVYDVPQSKRLTIFNYLKSLENTDMLNDIAKGLDCLDPKFNEIIFKRYTEAMKFNHFKNLPKKFRLKESEKINIPAQEVGNCNYYSLKGLFLAWMYHHNQKHYPKKQAYQKSLDDFMRFLKFDYNTAIDHYVAHAIRPNTTVLNLAKQKLGKMNSLTRESALNPANYKRQVVR
ncbi:MAG: hypothetical protein BGO43_14610 [Gammaproteobacteria bacterium 39-13]|nr:hypothetical protein [Gammaproteobacteria bacterium]OJV88826.1 MAG: hypothetical protein BGO43_14610 [Gammaproteobacteria bacterium 39-13]